MGETRHTLEEFLFLKFENKFLLKFTCRHLLAEETTQSTFSRSRGTAPKLDIASTKYWALGWRVRTSDPICEQNEAFLAFLKILPFPASSWLPNWSRSEQLQQECMPPQMSGNFKNFVKLFCEFFRKLGGKILQLEVKNMLVCLLSTKRSNMSGWLLPAHLVLAHWPSFRGETEVAGNSSHLKTILQLSKFLSWKKSPCITILPSSFSWKIITSHIRAILRP